jgi:O-antigen ligase
MLYVLIGYMWLFIHRPFEIWPVLGTLRVEYFYALGAMLVLAFYPGKRWVPNVQHAAYFAFAAAVALCWLCSPWAAYGELTVEVYFKVLVVYVMLMLVVHDERALKTLLLAFVVIMFLYMAHSLREYRNGRHTYRMGIARMIGVDKSLGDPNSFGASIVYALPFVTPFWMSNPSRRLRAFLVAYVLLSAVCIGLTGSRSAFLGLLLWGLLSILRSRWRWRLAVLAVVAAPLMWAALPPSLQNRFETIIHPEVGPANAIESGQDRIEGLRVGLKLWAESPLTGCGPGAWKPASRRLLESHNLFAQCVGEMGTAGLVTFAAVLVCFWVNLRRIRQAYRSHPEWGRDFLYEVARATGLALFLMLFEGNFGHNLFRYNWLWFGGFLIVLRHCLNQRLAAQARPAPARWQPRPAPAFAPA